MFVDEQYGGWIQNTRGTTFIDVIRSDRLEGERDHAMTLPHGIYLAPAVKHIERTRQADRHPDSIAAYGWPFRCVWARLEQSRTSGYVLAEDNWAFTADERQYRAMLVPRVLSVKPLWLGLLMNALFVFALACFAHGGFRLSRYIHRRRRGLCTRCGYVLSGAVHKRCPECGARQPLHVPAQMS